MKVLVTGAGGFLGTEIVRLLRARGDEVRALGRNDYPHLRSLGVETVRGDLRDREVVVAACQGVDVVHHVAAKAGVWGAKQEYEQINTQGTQHVIDGCLRHGVGRLAFTSSPSVTFEACDQVNVDETAPYARRWLCHYPRTKAAAEKLVLAANGVAHAQGTLLSCALRPHLIWGPGDPHLIPRLLERNQRKRLRQVGQGTNLIDITYVENAAWGQIQAADHLTEGSPVCGQAYFLSQGEPVNCWQWVNQVLQLAGQQPVTRRISAQAAWAAGVVLEAAYTLLRSSAEPPMTRFVAAQLSTSHYFNIRRAREDFGYQPVVSTTEGMERLARSLHK